MGVEREIFNFGDKKISLSIEHKLKIKEIIEKNKPAIVFAPYFMDKHQDHVNTAKLVSMFVPTIHYFISKVKNQNLGVDVTKTYKKKIEALDAHETQTRPGDVEWTDERHKDYGKKLGVKWGELFFVKEDMRLPSIFKKLNS